ncbi:LysR family transcriptional regulator [Streptomyces flavidovirens]|uniref:LysR family transcriptional regulator n=1 Tax=Streptomyces flavidovirens TaxID=67298 RepID=UPI003687ADB3
MDVGLHHLRCFLTLAEEKHFTWAADRLGISQPALSRSIRRLEELLGRSLLDRSARHTQLTPEGLRLQRELRALVPRLEAALRPASEKSPLRLGFAWGFPVGWGREAIDRFEERHHVLVHLVRRDDRLAGLGDAAADAALVWGDVPDCGLEAVELYREPRIAAISVRSTLAGRSEVGWSELGRRCLVLNTVSGSLTPGHWPPGAQPEVGAESRNIEEYLHAVAARRGVGVLPTSVARQHHDPDVRYIPLSGAPPAVLRYVLPQQGAHPLAAEFGVILRQLARRQGGGAPGERPAARELAHPAAAATN